MQEILQGLAKKLEGCGLGEVYTSFDALPVEQKSRKCFTVLGIEAVRSGEGYPLGQGAAYPLSLRIRVDLLTPMTESPQESLRLFFEKIVPALAQEECCLLCFDAGMPKPDVRLRKMVCGGTFSICGTLCVTEGGEGA